MTAKEHSDLFGKPLRRRRPKYEAALEQKELAQISERAARVRWLERVIPKRHYGMPLESFMVFNEATGCFIYGHYVATIVLCSAFCEHWLGSLVEGPDAEHITSKGLASIVSYCKTNQVLPKVICDKPDTLRSIRNPFIHPKPFDHPHNLQQRMMKQRTSPDEVLEQDAKQALIAMYSATIYFSRRTSD